MHRLRYPHRHQLALAETRGVCIVLADFCPWLSR
ncbi:hypothetical protein MalM25_15720 [Planctomycetes bacterium MalM25]|nr:hypothetical protein MalM25_15720 [Planctomycetes bacterium MalM25]